MTDEPEAPEPAADASTENRLDTLEEKITTSFDLLKGREEPPVSAPAGEAKPETAMSAEMREALALLKKHESDRQQALADDHTRALIAEAAPPEKKPAEYRRPTNIMKWVLESEK